ncbi:autotransporter outer membrane beta-barrel domain-containing protein, partial [Escherichia coli]|uniref:autotransporter outer membrane beta-barrel domain-containing protein n=1 Tax=Escherichia coli TaxID=562 RepID=UPI000DEC455B
PPAATNGIYNTLTTSELSGSGNFYLHTNIAGSRGDQLVVNNNATGNFKIFVQDTGISPQSDDAMTLVKTGGGDASFTLGNTGGFVDLGTYEYVLKSDGNSNWNLTNDVKPNPDPNPNPKPDPKPDPNPNPKPDPTPAPTPTPVPEKRITPSTAAVLNMAATLPLVFDAELNSIRERLNIMKASPHNNNVWGATYNTRNNVTTDAGAGFEQTLIGMTVGIDSRNDIPEGIATLGAFMGYSHSHIGFDRGGHGSVGSYSLGGYASWEHESGFYLDGIVKLNRFESNV